MSHPPAPAPRLGREFPRLGGYGIICAVPDCRHNTADQAPSRYWRMRETAVEAARRLGWIHAALQPGEEHVWFCPMHQRFEATAYRWVPAIRVAA